LTWHLQETGKFDEPHQTTNANTSSQATESGANPASKVTAWIEKLPQCANLAMDNSVPGHAKYPHHTDDK
jgi:hypothetical protein